MAVRVDDIFQRNQEEWAFDHENEHKPDHAPRWIGPKHDRKCSDMHHQKGGKGEPKSAMPKITLVLSEDKPEESTGPVEQPEPSRRNDYPGLGR
jgi:hypothetical protein